MKLRLLNEISEIVRNIVESVALYAQSQLGGIVEKGKICNPERLGRLTPQTRKSANKPER